MPILKDRGTVGKGNYAFSPPFFRPAGTCRTTAKRGFLSEQTVDRYKQPAFWCKENLG